MLGLGPGEAALAGASVPAGSAACLESESDLAMFVLLEILVRGVPFQVMFCCLSSFIKKYIIPKNTTTFTIQRTHI